MSIKVCIFDWAGTTVDFGCFAPIHAFADAFNKYGVDPTIEEVRQPMGMLKIDHIKTMLGMERIWKLWKETYKREPADEDINNIYKAFEEKLLKDLDQYATPIENVVEVVNQLRTKGIKIGSTTGYTSKMMEVVCQSARLQGYSPDYLSTADITGEGRPSPEMIYDNMKQFAIGKKEDVVKIGDTISDIKEGYHAGVWSVGVIKGSSALGLSAEEYGKLKDESIKEKVKDQYLEAGADFVLEEIGKLPELIERINILVGLGEKPNGYKL
ncbi:MAG: phosphonoacetaldehyde hydrolase [Anaerocolumna sp.]